MPRRLSWTLALLAVAFAAPTRAQEPQQQPQQLSAKEAAMMQAWMAYMTPGEPHQKLARDAGDWDHKVTMWMQPGAPPTESTATSKVQAILDGRYITEDFTGNFMGMPFEGHALIGYDNAKKKYFSTWIDNMGTGIMFGWGDMDEASNTLTITGTFVDPLDGQEKPFRQVFKHVTDDHAISEMYMPAPDGGEFKTMEIHSFKKTS